MRNMKSMNFFISSTAVSTHMLSPRESINCRAYLCIQHFQGIGLFSRSIYFIYNCLFSVFTIHLLIFSSITCFLLTLLTCLLHSSTSTVTSSTGLTSPIAKAMMASTSMSIQTTSTTKFCLLHHEQKHHVHDPSLLDSTSVAINRSTSNMCTMFIMMNGIIVTWITIIMDWTNTSYRCIFNCSKWLTILTQY